MKEIAKPWDSRSVGRPCVVLRAWLRLACYALLGQGGWAAQCAWGCTRVPCVARVPLFARALILVTLSSQRDKSMTQSFPSHAAAANAELGRTSAVPRNERVVILCANWHRDIVHQARDAAVAEFARHGLPPSQVVHYEVPGAFEIPLLAKKLARSGRYDAIVACALVVNGGIYRHEFVTSAVIDGMMRVQLDTEVPVLSAVLTPRDFHEHEDHLRFYREHFVKKGVEVAQACLATLDNLGALVESGSE
jgi:6,7-dimethyl-8-ribityllumazine synthase